MKTDTQINDLRNAWLTATANIDHAMSAIIESAGKGRDASEQAVAHYRAAHRAAGDAYLAYREAVDERAARYECLANQFS